MEVIGGTIRTKKESFLVKSHNIIIDMTNVDIASEAGILVHTILNDDPCATKPDELAYGVNVLMTDMDVKGDIIHDDDQRDMWITLTSTVLTGTIKNALLRMDIGSKWIATADSNVTILGNLDPAQIDAPAGVTVTAIGSKAAEFDLASGGKLIVTA